MWSICSLIPRLGIVLHQFLYGNDEEDPEEGQQVRVYLWIYFSVALGDVTYLSNEWMECFQNGTVASAENWAKQRTANVIFLLQILRLVISYVKIPTFIIILISPSILISPKQNWNTWHLADLWWHQITQREWLILHRKLCIKQVSTLPNKMNVFPWYPMNDRLQRCWVNCVVFFSLRQEWEWMYSLSLSSPSRRFTTDLIIYYIETILISLSLSDNSW